MSLATGQVSIHQKEQVVLRLHLKHCSGQHVDTGCLTRHILGIQSHTDIRM